MRKPRNLADCRKLPRNFYRELCEFFLNIFGGLSMLFCNCRMYRTVLVHVCKSQHPPFAMATLHTFVQLHILCTATHVRCVHCRKTFWLCCGHFGATEHSARTAFRCLLTIFLFWKITTVSLSFLQVKRNCKSTLFTYKIEEAHRWGITG